MTFYWMISSNSVQLHRDHKCHFCIGFRQRHAVINTFNSNSSELGHGSTPGPPITEDNFKRSISTPQFATPVPQLSDHMTGSQSDEQLRHFSITSSGSSTSLVSPESASRSSRTNVGKERAYIIKGLESDPSDSLMSWDMRNLENEAVMCCHELYSAVSSAQKDCMRDHLWHLLLKGANIEDTNAETYAWKSKSLRKKTEHRRTSSDFAENWAVPSSLKDVADSKSSVRNDMFRVSSLEFLLLRIGAVIDEDLVLLNSFLN